MTSENHPRVSVLMPVYNAERYLSEAIESILNQTYENFEFIIVNDGSTDQSLKIIRNFEMSDSRINIISRDNTGIVGALNDGLEIASGEYIARMDADDVSLPDRLEAQVDYMNSNPDCVIVGGHAWVIDPDGDILKLYRRPLHHEDIMEQLLQADGGAIVHPVAMFRKSAFDKVRGYRKEFELIEDLDLYLRLLECGKLANIDQTLIYYRQHLANITTRKGTRMDDLQKTLVLEARKKMGVPKIDIPVASRSARYSRSFQRRRWSCWALEENRFQTAWKHAWRAWLSKPWSRESIRLVSYILKKRWGLIS